MLQPQGDVIRKNWAYSASNEPSRIRFKVSSGSFQSHQQIFGAGLQRTLPNGGHEPTHIPQSCPISGIPGRIAVQLPVPKLPVRRRTLRLRTAMLVPEATMNKYGQPVSGKHQIRGTRQRRNMQPIAESCRPHPAPNIDLRASIPASNPGHHAGPFLWRQGIGHNQYQTVGERPKNITTNRQPPICIPRIGEQAIRRRLDEAKAETEVKLLKIKECADGIWTRTITDSSAPKLTEKRPSGAGRNRPAPIISTRGRPESPAGQVQIEWSCKADDHIRPGAGALGNIGPAPESGKRKACPTMKQGRAAVKSRHAPIQGAPKRERHHDHPSSARNPAARTPHMRNLRGRTRADRQRKRP